ncbi:hypothetical protein C8F01DRAFT_1153196 [Mycena amicta]|nr:hypothetical protein C8F01DRAFT_1153196 [Mycena amicta]
MLRISPCLGTLFLFLFFTQYTSALVFGAVGGPFALGDQVPLSWTLDGTEPVTGWELWYNAGGSSSKLENIPFSTVSTVVAFPGVNGTFQGITGTTLLATSAEVDAIPLQTTNAVFTTTTFSPSKVSGATNTGGPTTVLSQTLSPSNSAISESNAASNSPSNTTQALLGVIVGTLAVIAIIIIASIMLFVNRRRRAAREGDSYPFAPGDVEKQLAKRITPFPPAPDSPSQPLSSFESTSRSRTPSPPPLRLRPRIPPLRGTSLPQAHILARGRPSGPRSPSPPLPALPESGLSPIGDSRRTAYLNAQLEKLVMTQGQGYGQNGSLVLSPVSTLPPNLSENQPPALELPASPRMPPPLPPIPEPGTSGSRRDVYLSQQISRLNIAEQRRPSDGGSVIFSPLSTVPSERTVMAQSPVTQVSVSTAVNSPLIFRRPSAPSESDAIVSPRPLW